MVLELYSDGNLFGAQGISRFVIMIDSNEIAVFNHSPRAPKRELVRPCRPDSQQPKLTLQMDARNTSPGTQSSS